MIIQTLKRIPTADNEQIAVWKITDDATPNNNPYASSTLNTSNDGKSFGTSNRSLVKNQNILFIHGAFSDKGVCLGIASYFAAMGHQCYIIEWRGHGSSSQPQTHYHLEDIGIYDVTATLDYLLNELNLENLHCITHSGGGICLTISLTHNPQYIDSIKSITMFACQVFAAASTPLKFAKLLTLKALSRKIGVINGKRLKLGTMNENYYLLSQWMDWNLNQNFATYTPTTIRQQLIKKLKSKYNHASLSSISSEALDYRSFMPNITTPIYAICAADDVLAPPQACLKFLQAYKNSYNQYREFSLKNGDLEDYNHTRIFLSRNAAKEVWPTARDWVERHS